MVNKKRQIEVQLFPDGNIRVETHNIKGAQCLQYVELFEALLQAQVTDSAFTEEYNEAEAESTVLEEE